VVVNVTLTLKGLDEMQRQLEALSKKGLAAAARETLTGMAWAGRKIWQQRLEADNTLRNSFTARRVIVVPARGSQMKGMEASLGHHSEYVRSLEFGIEGTGARPGHAVGVPDLAARGGNIKKLVSRPNKLGTIGRLPTKRKGKTMKSRNAEALRVASKSGKKLAVLEGPKSRGIFKVSGRKKAKVRKLWDLSHKKVSRPKRPTLMRTVGDVLQNAPAIAQKAMEKQLALLK
jgi:hypothetical protein